uniref:Reverse transcriptase domain-containing protein n=1 Tax=Strongyloides papillosus TaxID=174720 RepID=A0A0N5CGF5_STREA
MGNHGQANILSLDRSDALKIVCNNMSDVVYDAGGFQERETGGRKVENGPLLELSMKRRNFKKERDAAVLDSRLACKLVSGNLCEGTGINEISEGKGTKEAQKIEKVVFVDRVKDPSCKIQELKKLSAMDKEVLKVKFWKGRENYPVPFEDDFCVGKSNSGPYEIQGFKDANVWIKPVNGGVVVKRHRKFLKKMLVYEWSPEKNEGGNSEVKEAESSKGEEVILK